MATNKAKTKVNVAEIDEQFGEFAVPNYSESIYPSLFHAIREVLGLKAQYALKQKNQKFDWKAFNQKFTEVMGDPKDHETRKYTLEQLIEYGTAKTGHSVEELLKINRQSWERRKKWQQQKNGENETQTIDDEF
ncbi:hypothetical protein [Allocoleopsis sp.]|uniref:hypothetical protein n=1 Tax=Allocoleopsis sp. TaxID=3088169 RepID=UPI002FD7084A